MVWQRHRRASVLLRRRAQQRGRQRRLPTAAGSHRGVDLAGLDPQAHATEYLGAVVGAGASAFDNAATALEHGAREVLLFCRREAPQVIQPYRWLTFRGFLDHLADLDDASTSSMNAFNLGYLDLEQRSAAERMFWGICSRVRQGASSARVRASSRAIRASVRSARSASPSSSAKRRSEVFISRMP
mgnify:CR=1 FL=1